MQKGIKNLLSGLAVVCLSLMLSVSVVLAASLAVTSIGGVSTGSGTITSFETTKTSPTFIGTAGADATVDITIDDLTVAVTADTNGDWSYTPTGLTAGAHSVEIASNLESLSFTLTVDTGSSSATESATTSKGGVSTPSAELPSAGNFDSTLILIAGGLFLMGLGVTAHSLLPVPDRDQD